MKEKKKEKEKEKEKGEGKDGGTGQLGRRRGRLTKDFVVTCIWRMRMKKEKRMKKKEKERRVTKVFGGIKRGLKQ